MLRFLSHPLPWLGLTVLAAIALLASPIRLPIGAMYWDLYFTVDGAYRVSQGQTPHLDFFAPSGALPFYLLAAVQAVFERAQPLLAAQYGYLLVTAPLMTLVALDVRRRSAAIALALVLPFCALSLAPINAIEFFDSPGVDGVGLYNRQSGLVLYVLLAALFGMAAGWSRTLVAAIALAALFLSKINAFAPAAVLVVYLAVAGLSTLRAAALMLAGAALLIAAIDGGLGLLPAYLSDIAALSAHNARHVGSRMATLVSVKFDVILPLALLTAALLLRDLPALVRIARDVPAATWPGRWGLFQKGLQAEGVLLAVCFVMALVIEMQNTGSQEFAFLWPLLAMIGARLLREATGRPRPLVAVAAALLAAATLPTAMTLIKRTARAAAISPMAEPVPVPELRALDSVRARMHHLSSARAQLVHYAAGKPAYEALARLDEMPYVALYSDPSFQTGLLLATADAARALLALEAREGRRFSVIYTASNVDILPYALGRMPLKGVTVSLDLHRGFPASRQPRLVAALAGADAILLPRCPVTPYKLDVEALIATALTGRRRIALTDCFDVALKP